MGILDKIFITCVIFLLCIILIIYKLIKKFIFKNKLERIGFKITKIITVIIIFIIVVGSIKIGIFLYKNPQIIDPDYDRGMYSVVLYNDTDKEINEIYIYAGSNKILVSTAYNIQKGEYRKINISTHQSDFIDSILPPYNVYVKSNSSEICVGYFGINTGGIELVNIIKNGSEDISLILEPHSSNRYIKVNRMDRKNQDIVSWYN